jgi:hypothetical protein
MTPTHAMLQKTFIFGAFATRARPFLSQILRPAAVPEGDRLAEFLAEKTSDELSPGDIRAEVEGNLRMLGPEAFRYFLPAFVHHTLDSYHLLRDFAVELVEALTEPSRMDIVESLDRMEGAPPDLRLPHDLTSLLRKQQLEWFDTGAPASVFHARFDDLSQIEGEVILTFLVSLKAEHGMDFPFAALEKAAGRFWSRYRNPP